ncbi:MAG: hypothetical protein ACKPHU_28505, partial [Planctomycetaceae bacterium]
RRGVEVDHTFYLPKENMQLGQLAAATEADGEDEDGGRGVVRSSGGGTAAGAGGGVAVGAGQVQELQQQLVRVQQQCEQLLDALDAARRRLDRLERELGLV